MGWLSLCASRVLCRLKCLTLLSDHQTASRKKQSMCETIERKTNVIDERNLCRIKQLRIARCYRLARTAVVEVFRTDREQLI